MSEEKKDFVLKEEDLKNINGGFYVESCTFDAGDCFEDEKGNIYKVLNYERDVNIAESIECLVYLKQLDKILEKTQLWPVTFLANNCKFIGNNLI